MEIYQKALRAMPVTFSTNQYLASLRKLETSDEEISRKFYLEYLNTECNKVTNRTYFKKEGSGATNGQPVITDAMCIKQLKEKGYRILRPNWEEI